MVGQDFQTKSLHTSSMVLGNVASNHGRAAGVSGSDPLLDRSEAV